MTKTMILSAAMMLSSVAAMAQSGTFQLKADLKNFSKDTVVVWKGRSAKQDTVLLKKGKLVYSATLDKPSSFYFMTPSSYKGKERSMFNFICVPGEKAELKGDLKTRYDITGSKFYKEYGEVDLMSEAAGKELNDFTSSISEKMRNGGDEKALMAEYEEKSPAMRKAKNEKVLDFMKQHPNYDACATLIQEFDGYDEMTKAANVLSGSVRNGRMKAFIDPMLARAKKQKEADEKAKVVQAAGAEATDFTLDDINGKPFTLSSLRGKYVILDFWGSWCGWCIKGMPKMKEYYAKYAGKFEIVGVDCNDTVEKWKAAVKKHELPWLHVYNKKGSDSDVTSKYAIQGFPTKIVVGPDGKIVKTIVGEDPAFYTFLDELFSK